MLVSRCLYQQSDRCGSNVMLTFSKRAEQIDRHLSICWWTHNGFLMHVCWSCAEPVYESVATLLALLLVHQSATAKSKPTKSWSETKCPIQTLSAFHYNPTFGLWCFLHLRWPTVYGGGWGMHRLYTFLNKLCISTKLFKWTQIFGRNEFIFTKCFQLQVRFDKMSIYDYILGDFLTLQMIYFIKMFIRIHL